MVSALLEGRKTQTRRVLKPQPMPGTHLKKSYDNLWYPISKTGGYRAKRDEPQNKWKCPYGNPGDRLWVRETWSHDAPTLDECKRTFECDGGYGPYYKATEVAPDSLKWKPSIHMPRWASRITLEVTSVRVERLTNINTSDAMAEGIPSLAGEARAMGLLDDSVEGHIWDNKTTVENFRDLWESINGEGSWIANPWVWVVEFKRLAPTG